MGWEAGGVGVGGEWSTICSYCKNKLKKATEGGDESNDF